MANADAAGVGSARAKAVGRIEGMKHVSWFRLPWGFILKRTMRSFTVDACTDLAAGLTYFAVLSLFPAMIALVSILGLIGQSEAGINALFGIVEQVAPGSLDAVKQPIREPGLLAGERLGSRDRDRRRDLVGVGIRRRVRPRSQPRLPRAGGPPCALPAPHAARGDDRDAHPHRHRRRDARDLGPGRDGDRRRPRRGRDACRSSGRCSSGRCSSSPWCCWSRSSTTRRRTCGRRGSAG